MVRVILTKNNVSQNLNSPGDSPFFLVNLTNEFLVGKRYFENNT